MLLGSRDSRTIVLSAPDRGMTLIDVVIGIGLIVIIFSGLFGLLRASILLSTMVQSESTASAIANSQMEYIRSLSYDSIGTVGGIPSGSIAQNATTTRDGVGYGVRTFIEYYDDPADGTGSSDSNGITTDYKRIKVTVMYKAGKLFKQLALISNYVPSGIETTVNGGTLQVKVVNAAGAPVPGATVQVVNASTSPAVNLTTFSDSTGTVLLPGAATSTQYAVTVSKDGYSTAQTYVRTVTNQNPTPGYLTIAKSQTTTGTFAIDVLGTLTVQTYLPIASSTFIDTFTNSSKLASLSNTVVSGGVLALANTSGSYALSGSALSTTTQPKNLTAWSVASTTRTVPAGTTASFHVVDKNGTILPESVLLGNAAGFTGSVNLSNISTSTYPALALSASLQTTSTSTTPSIVTWGIGYSAGPVPLPNVPFMLTGAKQIGSTGAGAPLYKTTVSGTTDATGSLAKTLEWDSYAISVPGYDVIDSCNASPYALSPGALLTESLTLASSTANSLLVSVTDSAGAIVPGASVTLSRSGFTKTVLSTACGSAYFGGVTSATTYSVGLQKTGYTSTTANNVTVSGATFYGASF